MSDVVSLPPRPRYKDPLGCITITRSDESGLFDVRAWFGGPPCHADTDLIYCGARATLFAAAMLAREKARDLGIREIADLSSIEPPSPSGAA